MASNNRLNWNLGLPTFFLISTVYWGFELKAAWIEGCSNMRRSSGKCVFACRTPFLSSCRSGACASLRGGKSQAGSCGV